MSKNPVPFQLSVQAAVFQVYPRHDCLSPTCAGILARYRILAMRGSAGTTIVMSQRTNPNELTQAFHDALMTNSATSKPRSVVKMTSGSWIILTWYDPPEGLLKEAKHAATGAILTFIKQR